MTNHWNDIDNASLVLVYGANPAENHPACMAHVNAARFGNKSAKLIVVDPRKTRTALQADMYVRIRPGTNVAFTNGLMKWIFDNIGTYDAAAAANMLAYHNTTVGALGSVARTFVDDAGATRTMVAAELAGAKYNGTASTGFTTVTGTPNTATYPKYADTRMVVNAAGDDYERRTLTTTSNTGTAAWQFTDFPVVAPTVTAQVDGLDTVWTWLKAHLAPYDAATVADICGCTAAELIAVAQAIVDNSRFKSSDWNAGTATPQVSTYKATTILYAMGQTQHTNGSQNIKDLAIIQTLMGNMGRAGGGINALRGIHNVQGSTDMGLLYDSIPAYGSNPTVGETFSHYINTQFGNRTTGNTAALAASATVRGTAANSGIIYTAKAGGVGGNSIRIQYLDPAAPSSALSVGVSGNDITVNLQTNGSGAIISNANDIKAAVDGFPAAAALVSTAIAVSSPATNGTGVVTAKAFVSLTGGTAALAELSIVPGKCGLQQRGFYNMTTEWFGNGTSSGADVALLYNLWPKGNGVQHIQTFRYMAAGTAPASLIKAAVVWGQNPAVTEPNQSAVRIGLKNLELMVVVDMFETETAAVDRKAGAPTYLIPTCAHTEESGSVTNSGRWLQWRERCTPPKGNSKADLELLLRFAYSLDKAGAFSHMTDVAYSDNGSGVPASGVWSTLSAKINGPAYKVLYGNKYGWTPTDATSFEATVAAAGAIERWAPGATAPQAGFVAAGSEVFTEAVFKEMCRPLNYTATTGGTMWIYSGSDTGAAGVGEGATPGASAWNDGVSWNSNYMPVVTSAGNTVTWQTKNRAKSRYNVIKGNDTNGANNFPRWGWAWLLNRRVFYNNGEVSGDQADNFVGPGLVAMLYTAKTPAPAEAGLADWSLVYRKYKTFADGPSVATGPHFVSAGKTFMGRFPGHTEPTESPRNDLVTTWGRNYGGGAPLYWTGANPTTIGTFDTTANGGPYPLVLTSIRCVEHFQGGPITRNNSWNVEAEPVPWIEINSVDARTYGISDGQWVNVITARSNSTSDQEGRSPNSGTGWAMGFKARVGVGLQSNQRVGPGVVAIPWHWGDKGLSTGSRANDLCIDAWDANTQIPEYKACLCKIVGL